MFMMPMYQLLRGSRKPSNPEALTALHFQHKFLLFGLPCPKTLSALQCTKLIELFNQEPLNETFVLDTENDGKPWAQLFVFFGYGLGALILKP